MKHGRLRISSIHEHTALSPRQVRHGLAILVQQNLALWATDEQYETTHYEADWRNAYALLRYGKLTEAVDFRFGKETSCLLSDFLLAGHLRVHDLRRAHSLAHQARVSQVNGLQSDGEARKTDSGFDSAIQNLLHERFVCVGNRSQFHPEADNYDRAELRTRRRAAYSEKIKKKDESAFRTAIDDLVRSWLEGPSRDSNGQMKRRPEDDDTDSELDDNPVHKKRCMENGEVKLNGYSHNNVQTANHFDDELVLRVNNHKAAVTARSDWLVKLVQERIGFATATVYYAVLRLLEPNFHQCGTRKRNVEALPADETVEQPCVSTQAIVSKIVDFEELKAQMGSVKGRHRNSVSLDRDSDSEMNIDEQDSPESESFIVHRHLRLLSESNTPLLNRHPRSGTQPETWSIPFEALSKQLRTEVLDRNITSQYGALGSRIASLLRQFGKMDDPSILRRLISKRKRCKSLLTKMLKSGKLEVQELPRDNNRVPSRTVWLWYFDPERCGQKVLDETYQTMLRCLQRLRHERKSHKDTLAKAARTDVVGREEEYLSKAELSELKEWRTGEERLLGELGRLDEIVLVLRDMQGI